MDGDTTRTTADLIAQTTERILTQLLPGVGTIPKLYAESVLRDILTALARNVAEAQRAKDAQVAALIFLNNPQALHPDAPPFPQLPEPVQHVAHATAQIIAFAIEAAPNT